MGKIRSKYVWLTGNKMTVTAFGMTACSHGVYYENWETYHYGIKGLFGLRIFKEWGYNY